MCERVNDSGNDEMMVCPFCGESVSRCRFCPNCGKNMEGWKKDVVTIENPFADEDRILLDKLLYNVRLANERRNNEAPAHNGGNTIRALGDIKNLPSDYQGSVYSTGNITFADEGTSHLLIRYSDFYEKKVAFKSSLVIKRSDGDVIIQTDLGTYRIADNELGRCHKNLISRTPIAIIKMAGRFFMLCEKDSYIVLDDEYLDGNRIYQVAPFQHLVINTHWSMDIEL